MQQTKYSDFFQISLVNTLQVISALLVNLYWARKCHQQLKHNTTTATATSTAITQVNLC